MSPPLWATAQPRRCAPLQCLAPLSPSGSLPGCTRDLKIACGLWIADSRRHHRHPPHCIVVLACRQLSCRLAPPAACPGAGGSSTGDWPAAQSPPHAIACRKNGRVRRRGAPRGAGHGQNPASQPALCENQIIHQPKITPCRSVGIGSGTNEAKAKKT